MHEDPNVYSRVLYRVQQSALPAELHPASQDGAHAARCLVSEAALCTPKRTA